MAIAGGRPRGVVGERQFYDVTEPTELRGALSTITDSISRCVFTVAPVPSGGDLVDVRIDGVTIPRDRGRSDGWDFTTAERTELTLFGGACERLTATAGEVDADIECPAE